MRSNIRLEWGGPLATHLKWDHLRCWFNWFIEIVYNNDFSFYFKLFLKWNAKLFLSLFLFKLNFSWEMSKMHYYTADTNFQKSPNVGSPPPPQHPLIFDFRDLKLRDLAKLCIFKLIMRKFNLKNQLWRHYITDKRHETNVTKFFHFGPLIIKISGYAVVSFLPTVQI